GPPGTTGPADTGDTDAPHGNGKPPSKYLPELPLFPVGGRLAYNPHRGFPHLLKGTAHAHCDENHGTPISCPAQMSRLRDLDNGNGHECVWMTTHNRVQADPGVDGVLYMFGLEAYTSDLGDGAGTPHVTGLLPEGGGNLTIGQTHPLEPVG